MKRLSRIALMLLLSFLINTSFAFINGDFELADPPLAGEDFGRPTGWVSENYAAVRSNFIPNPPYGQALWLVPNNEIVPHSGNSFLMMSTGEPLDDIIFISSSAAQTISEPLQGKTLQFYYFFGTADYRPYEDTATAKLFYYDYSMGTELLSETILSVSVATVGDFSSTPGWLKCEYAIAADDPRDFQQVVFEVLDVRDVKYPSYFAVDSLVIIPEPLTVAFLLMGSIALIKRKRA